MAQLCMGIIIISVLLIIWFLIIRFQEENFRESINAEPKLGKKLIRGSSIYFAKNSRVDKGYLSKQKF